jgi:hypothetical protein
MQTDSHHVRSNISSSSQPAARSLKPVKVSSCDFLDVLIYSLLFVADMSLKKPSCETQGCKNPVPLDTKWPRCTNCSLNRWRARLQSNHTQAENSPKSEGRKISKIRRARDMIKEDSKQDASSIPGWDSDLTELSFSEAESSENESNEDPDKVCPKGLRSFSLHSKLSNFRSGLDLVSKFGYRLLVTVNPNLHQRHPCQILGLVLLASAYARIVTQFFHSPTVGNSATPAAPRLVNISVRG